ncbi:MAG TPA: biotin--[acetyl-CoA-carboxylase] ligase [Rubrivivax sp.]|nr:biotin--[acetyl-CoA-carboxylase] ligase [Rubrivivax sp.]
MSPVSEPAHLRWGAEALWQQLLPLLPGLTVEVVGRTDSTNTRLIERARAAAGDPDAPVTRPGRIEAVGRERAAPYGRRAGDVEPCLLVAEQQTRGRGRLGRDWTSNPIDSLTFSLALEFEPVEWSGLSLAVGLALAEALDDAAPPAAPRIGLKWPNDLWLFDGARAGRKLGGILIETLSVGGRRMGVIGVGLNVRPVAVDGVATASLQELLPGIDAPAALARVALPLVRALRRFEHEGFAPLVAAYARRDLLRGQAIGTNGEAGHGVADGVDAEGALRLRDSDARLHRITSGEVSVRLHGAGVQVPAGAVPAGAVPAGEGPAGEGPAGEGPPAPLPAPRPGAA